MVMGNARLRLAARSTCQMAIASAITVLGTNAVTAPNLAAQAGPLPGLEDYLVQSMQEWRVPGLALAIVVGDSVVLAKGYGLRTVGSGDRVDAHTVFAIGSVTKSFTCTLLGMLVEDGVLDLEDPAMIHLPGFLLYDPYLTTQLTVRDLVTHRTGLSGGDLLWYNGTFTRPEIVRRLRYLKPRWNVREKFDYQNLMFVAVGEMMQTVTRKTWDELVRDRIFTPLRMTRTTTTVRQLPRLSNVASPHALVGGAVQAIPWRNVDNTPGGGGINSSVAEMAAWIRMHLNRGLLDGRRIVAAEFVEEMQQPQTIIRRVDRWALMTPKAHFMAYGLGWFLSDYRGRKVVQHGGGVDGMTSLVAMMPEENLGIVILSNLDSNHLPTVLMMRVFDAYLGLPPTDWSRTLKQRADRLDRDDESIGERLRATDTLGGPPTLPLDSYAGVYRSDLYGDVIVEYRSGQLHITHGEAFNGVLQHVRDELFRAAWASVLVPESYAGFILDVHKKPGELTIYFWEPATFRRVEATQTNDSLR